MAIWAYSQARVDMTSLSVILGYKCQIRPVQLNRHLQYLLHNFLFFIQIIYKNGSSKNSAGQHFLLNLYFCYPEDLFKLYFL